MASRDALMSLTLERALRWAAVRHAGQVRKGGNVPYVEHLMGVALILDRLGFEEDLVIAGLLHDVVEDTATTLAEVEAEFGPIVADLVGHGSELKTDEQGQKRPWSDRKRDHLEALTGAPVEARALVLADKLHNLTSIALDLREGRPVWSLFNAERSDVLGYYRTSIERLGTGDPRLETLATRCRALLDEVEHAPVLPGPPPEKNW